MAKPSKNMYSKMDKNDDLEKAGIPTEIWSEIIALRMKFDLTLDCSLLLKDISSPTILMELWRMDKTKLVISEERFSLGFWIHMITYRRL